MSVLRLPRCYIIYILLTHPSPLCVQLTTCRAPSAVQLREGPGGGSLGPNAIQEVLLLLAPSYELFLLCFFLRDTAVSLRSLSFRADLNPAFLKSCF